MRNCKDLSVVRVAWAVGLLAALVLAASRVEAAEQHLALSAVDQVVEAPCPKFGAPAPTQMLGDARRAERLSDLNWRAASSHAQKVFDTLITDSGPAPSQSERDEANELLARLGTALSAYTQSQWALAQMREPTYPPDASRPYPLFRLIQAGEKLEGLARAYRDNKVADAFIGPTNERFQACMVSLQNDIIVANEPAIRAALAAASPDDAQALLERYAPLSRSFSAPGVSPPQAVTALFAGLADPPSHGSEATLKSVADARALLRRQTVSTFAPPPNIATPTPTHQPSPPRPTQAPAPPPTPSADAIASAFLQAVKSGGQTRIRTHLAPNVTMWDPHNKSASGSSSVSRNLGLMGRDSRIRIGNLRKQSATRFSAPVSSSGGSATMTFRIGDGKVTSINIRQ